MFLSWSARRLPGARFPHACGDVPPSSSRNSLAFLFSPRMWGCSAAIMFALPFCLVFPTHVGMFRMTVASLLPLTCFPHACGDVPGHCGELTSQTKFSPRMWGCSALGDRVLCRALVFPTHVGMFRSALRYRKPIFRFPHACGDVPHSQQSGRDLQKFSPRMWGCSDN